MKIAIFSGEIPSSTFIEALIKGVAEHHEVLLFGVVIKKTTYHNPKIKIIETPFSRLKNLFYNTERSLRLLLKSPKSFFSLLKEVRKYNSGYDQRIWFTKFLPIVLYKPDILHLQWARDVEFYGFLKKFGIKIVVSLRGAHINYTPIIDNRAKREYLKWFPVIDGFHAVSSAIAKLGEQYGASANKITIIHSPLSLTISDKFSKFQEKQNCTFKIISIGRFHWIKGLRYAIDACAILKKQGFNFQYEIISTNLITEEVLFQINQLALSDQVKILDKIDQNKLIELMSSYNVLLLPSLDEGIANVVLEAMAIGVPVISTDCGGMPEVVKPNETGWLVPTRNPQAIADAIIDVSQTPESEIQRITTNAHNIIKQEFDYETSITKFIEFYERILAE